MYYHLNLSLINGKIEEYASEIWIDIGEEGAEVDTKRKLIYAYSKESSDRSRQLAISVMSSLVTELNCYIEELESG